MPCGAGIGALMTLPDSEPAWVTAPAGMVTFRPPVMCNEADFPGPTSTAVAGAAWLQPAIRPATVKVISTPHTNRLEYGNIPTLPTRESLDQVRSYLPAGASRDIEPA